MNKYHLGSGGNYRDGWINVDKYAARADSRDDLREMKFKPTDHIESHHVFEHFGYVDSFLLLIKWSLAVKIGGAIVIDIPDPYRIAQAMYGGSMRKQRACIRLMFGSHEGEWAYHINGWTPDMLSETLKQFGLKEHGRRLYGGPQGDFPHMGIEMTFYKRGVVAKNVMLDRAKKMLKDYTHDNEVQLYKKLSDELDRKVNKWVS